MRNPSSLASSSFSAATKSKRKLPTPPPSIKTATTRKRPPAPEDISNTEHRFFSPTMLVGGILLGFLVVFISVHMMTVKDRPRIFLQLTMWTHALVAIYLLCMRTMDEKRASILGIAVLGISIAVMMGRFTSIHAPAKSAWEVVEDLITHVVVPSSIFFFVMAGYVPRVHGDQRGAGVRTSVGYALIFLGFWLFTNLVAQYARNGQWVYRTFMNPKSEQGRKDLAKTALVSIFCVFLAAGIEYSRSQKSIDISPEWPEASSSVPSASAEV